MRGIKRFVPSPAMVVATIALAVALGGTGWAAGSSNLAQAGADQNAGPTKAGGPTATGQRGPRGPRGFRGPRGLRGLTGLKGATGLQGPAGPQGPAGTAGTAGAAATSLWASVDGTGTLVRNKGAVSAQQNATGSFQVIFNQDITNCVYQASLGGPTTGLFLGYITVAQRATIPAGVTVLTFNTTPAAANFSFFVSVFC